jgi:hypothetical protein
MDTVHRIYTPIPYPCIFPQSDYQLRLALISFYPPECSNVFPASDEKGILDVYRFVKYFTIKRGVDESLFEGKLLKLLDIVETWLAFKITHMSLLTYLIQSLTSEYKSSDDIAATAPQIVQEIDID